MSEKLQEILARFSHTYSKLEKKELKKFNNIDQLRICKDLSCSEVISLPQECAPALKQTLTEEINTQVEHLKDEDNHMFYFKLFLLLNLDKQNALLIFQLFQLVQSKIEVHMRQQHFNQEKEVDQDEEQDLPKPIKKDLLAQKLLDLLKIVLKKLFKLGDSVQGEFYGYCLQSISSYLKEDREVELIELQPHAFTFKILCHSLKIKHLAQKEAVMNQLKLLLELSSLGLTKIIRIHEEHKKRQLTLYNSILDSMVGFSCSYLKLVHTLGLSQHYHSLCLSLWHLLLKDSPQEHSPEDFILRERIKVLGDLNPLLSTLPEINTSEEYWKLIKDGLVDSEAATRKIALEILKANLKQAGEGVGQGVLPREEFEQLWTTFFDIFDTLESFGSHLIKAVWERTEVFYKFIQANYKKSTDHFPYLLDFKGWLLLLYRRVTTHNNLKVRKFVQKHTLKRSYMTTVFQDYLFSEFMRSLNKGLLFKDSSNLYTQFSKNNALVVEFYDKYLRGESIDVSYDLKFLFRSFLKNVTHPQLILSMLKVLSKRYSEQISGFIGTEELKIFNEMINLHFSDQNFGNKYLCFKFIFKILALYIDPHQVADLDWGQFFRILGHVPIQFCSVQTVYQDEEALQYAQHLVQQVGIEAFKSSIRSYFSDAILVKASLAQMPKFGSLDIHLVLQGVAKCLLMLERVEKERHHKWHKEFTGEIYQGLNSILSSSYLSPDLQDQKLKYLVDIIDTLYRFASDPYRQVIREDFLANSHLLLDRMNTHLLQPCLQDGSQKHSFLQNILNNELSFQLSEKTKLISAIKELDTYAKLLGLLIYMSHIHMNQSFSPLEKTIQLALQNNLQLQQVATLQQGFNLGNYVSYHILFSILSTTVQSYSKGIKECLKKQQQYFFIPEVIFTFGKPLFSNLISLRVSTRLDPTQRAQFDSFQIESDIAFGKLQDAVLTNQWQTIAGLIEIFQFESSLKQELPLHLEQIIERALEFYSTAAEGYYRTVNMALNSVLLCLKQIICSGAGPFQVPVEQDLKQRQSDLLVQFQSLIEQNWKCFIEQENNFDISLFQDYLEIIFSGDLLEFYLYSLDPQNQKQNATFHQKMAHEIFESGNKYWLIARATFNHLMLTFCQRPYLIKQFEQFVINFSLCREIRSLDAEINLQRLENLIPQAVGKDKEWLNMEDITYHGAYIRAMTLLIVEELIHSSLQQMLFQNITQSHMEFLSAMENMIIQTIDINFLAKYAHADMPYTEKHRVKVRLWQFLIVCLQLLSPKLYTVQFRQQRKQYSGLDVIEEICKRMWKVLQLVNLPSIRQYYEIFAIRFISSFPKDTIENPQFEKQLLDFNLKPQAACSYLVIAGFILTNHIPEENAVTLKQKIFQRIVGFLTSNAAHIRCVAQYFIHELQKDPQFSGFIPSGLDPLLQFLNTNRDAQKMLKRYAEELKRLEKIAYSMTGSTITLTTPIDQYGEFLSEPFVELLKEAISYQVGLARNQDTNPIKREDLWKQYIIYLQTFSEIQLRKEREEFKVRVNEQSSSNYQRKVLPWEQIEFDYETMKRNNDNRVRNSIIMCATLIDKIPNLGGLARTSEIMNASALIVNNKSIVENEEFRGVAVTSEKWLPIYEVPEKHLSSYLELQKSNGYTILGLEQTANSKSLEKFEFPKKCVLLLGKEKEGIPQEFLGYLDECIEIPQFGIIRSLNVHVSGSICLWEYTKQHMPKN